MQSSSIWTIRCLCSRMWSPTSMCSCQAVLQGSLMSGLVLSWASTTSHSLTTKIGLRISVTTGHHCPLLKRILLTSCRVVSSLSHTSNSKFEWIMTTVPSRQSKIDLWTLRSILLHSISTLFPFPITVLETICTSVLKVQRILYDLRKNTPPANRNLSRNRPQRRSYHS